MKAPIVVLQAAIGGFSGESLTIYGALNTETGQMLVDKEGKFTDPLLDGAVKLANMDSADASIRFVISDHLRDAIEAYLLMDAAQQLRIGDKLQRFSPKSRLQTIKVTDTGPTREIGSDISNGQVAVLALAWLARRQVTHAAAVHFTRQTASKLYELEII